MRFEHQLDDIDRNALIELSGGAP
jgi:hypothetical protein